MTPSSARRVLEFCDTEVPQDLLARRYVWFRDVFLVALDTYEQAFGRLDELYRNSMHLKLTMHDILGAPLAAIATARKLIEAQPEWEGAWYELSELLERVGKQSEAEEARRQADALCESPPNWVSDLGSFGREFEEGDPGWEAMELLATLQPADALQRLSRHKGIRARLARARVQGALANAAGVLREWRAISGLKSRFGMESADWFYVPNEVEEDPKFWACLLRIPPDRHEFSGWWPNYDGLNAYFPYDLSRGSRTDAQSKRLYIDQRRTVLAFELARTSHDLPAARELSTKYPDWEEAQELAAELSASIGRVPPRHRS
jgi:tetratricopeptide (TPR) repeat protein